MQYDGLVAWSFPLYNGQRGDVYGHTTGRLSGGDQLHDRLVSAAGPRLCYSGLRCDPFCSASYSGAYTINYYIEVIS